MNYGNYYQYPTYYPQQSFSNNIETMRWIEGMVGAQAYQMPPGLPANTPIALWDSTEKKVFLKSWNQMGMANPIQELTYEIKEQPSAMISGASQDMSQYVTKHDLDELRQELRNAMNSNNNQNNRNRGGNQ